jgi:lipopolysaccharide biosynthesis glycosyltransferase
MLLAHEIPEKDLKWFRDKGILIKKCKPLYNKKIWKYPSIILDKFYLFTPEFKKWKNIVYLDSDIIVRASLDKLTKLHGFWACPDLDMKLINQFNDKISYKDNIKGGSFNSGLMAFSTDIIDKNSFPDLNNLVKNYINISKGDQSIFNLFFYNSWKKLPPLYNIFPMSNLYPSFNTNDGIILHFVRFDYKNTKPWNQKNPFYNEWKTNLDRADAIDLNNIPKGKKWNNFKILRYSLYLFYSFYKRKVSNFIELKAEMFSNSLLKLIGKIGQSIKKRNPNLYYKLKGYKK